MKPLLAVHEFEQSYKDQILSELKRRFGVELETVNFVLLSSIPRYSDYQGKDCFEVSKYKDYILITDFSPIGTGHNIRQIPDMEDVGYVVELIAGLYIVPKVFWTDELEWAKKMIAKLPDTFAYDIETMPSHTLEEVEEAKLALESDPTNVELLKVTRANSLMQEYNVCTMHSFSLDHERSFVLINTPEIEEYVLNFLTTTDKQVPMHNASFDMGYVYHRTGKFIKNYEDTALIAQAYLNSVNQPLFGLKSLAAHLNSSWGEEKGSFDLYEDSSDYKNEYLVYRGSNPKIKEYNLPLVYYCGVDTQMTHIFWSKYSEIDPEWTSVSIDDILPIIEPRDAEDTPRFFYENVLKPILPSMIQITQTPMPIDMDIIQQIKQDALDKKEPAMEKLKNFPEVKSYMETVVSKEIEKFTQPLIEKNLIEDRNPKTYKNTMLHRALLVNEVLGTDNEKWSVTDVKKEIEKLKEEL